MENDTRIVKPDFIREQSEQITKVMADVEEFLTGKGHEVLRIESRLTMNASPEFDSMKISFVIPFPNASELT